MPVYIHIKRLDIKSLSSVTSFIFISQFLDLHKEQGKMEKTVTFMKRLSMNTRNCKPL